jgi:hypothetical protein
LDVILHIGLPKTGSSFLQRWLDLNNDFVAYLPNEYGGNRLAIECCDMREFAGRSDFIANIERTSLQEIRAQLAAFEVRYAPRLIISSEYFFLARPAAIRTKFAEFGLNVVKIICLLRRQDRIIASGFAQDVKALNHKDPIAISPGGYTAWYDWLKLMNDYQSAFPAAEFVPLEFDYMRKTGGLLARWKHEIGCVSDTFDSILFDVKVNPSLPGELVEVCRAANQLGIPYLSSFALMAAQDGLVAGNYALPSEHQEEIRNGFADLNDKFVSKLRDPTGFEDYTKEHWQINDGSPVNLEPATVARLLDYALKRNA